MSYAQTAGQFGSLGSGTAAGSANAYATNNSGQGGGGMGGGIWGMVAQYAMQELDREKQDRGVLFQGLVGALDDSQWLMSHYPQFYSTPQVQTTAVAQPYGQNAPSQLAATLGTAANTNNANSSAEFRRWRMTQGQTQDPQAIVDEDGNVIGYRPKGSVFQPKADIYQQLSTEQPAQVTRRQQNPVTGAIRYI
jgi:hypothetical protein